MRSPAGAEEMSFLIDQISTNHTHFFREIKHFDFLREVGGIGRVVAAVSRVVPGAGRDAGYRLVARWRRRFFGAARAGALARPEWSGRFLD